MVGHTESEKGISCAVMLNTYKLVHRVSNKISGDLNYGSSKIDLQKLGPLLRDQRCQGCVVVAQALDDSLDRLCSSTLFHEGNCNNIRQAPGQVMLIFLMGKEFKKRQPLGEGCQSVA